MKKSKRMLSLILAAMLIAANLSVTALAAAPMQNEKTETITYSLTRASNSFELTIPAGKIVKADTSFSLAARDTVEFNAVYTPKKGSLDVGLIAPDGLFYSFPASDGRVDGSITVDTRGKYTFALRNNSSFDVSISGFVDY